MIMAIGEGKVRFQVTFSDELNEKMEAYCKDSGISKSAYLSLLAARDLEATDKFILEFRNELQEVISRLNISDE